MRILSGRWAGRHLLSPGRRVRPTAEPVRDQALRWVEKDLRGARVLDLFAGTGAVGLEALSRGAASVDFVERSPAALHALKGNIARLRVQKTTRLFKKDALAFLDGVEPGDYDLVFADPPYSSALAPHVAQLWLERRFAPVLLLEAPRELEFPGRPKLKVSGDTALVLYRGGRRVARARGSD